MNKQYLYIYFSTLLFLFFDLIVDLQYA